MATPCKHLCELIVFHFTLARTPCCAGLLVVDAAWLLPEDADPAARKAMPYLFYSHSCPDDDVDEVLAAGSHSAGGGTGSSSGCSGGKGSEGSSPDGDSGGGNSGTAAVACGMKGHSAQKQPFCDCSRLADLPAEEGDEARRALLLWMRRTGGHLPLVQTGGKLAVTFRLSQEVAEASGGWHTMTVSLPAKAGRAVLLTAVLVRVGQTRERQWGELIQFLKSEWDAK